MGRAAIYAPPLPSAIRPTTTKPRLLPGPRGLDQLNHPGRAPMPTPQSAKAQYHLLKHFQRRRSDLLRDLSSSPDRVTALLALHAPLRLPMAALADVDLQDLVEHGSMKPPPPPRGEGPRIAAGFGGLRSACG